MWRALQGRPLEFGFFPRFAPAVSYKHSAPLELAEKAAGRATNIQLLRSWAAQPREKYYSAPPVSQRLTEQQAAEPREMSKLEIVANATKATRRGRLCRQWAALEGRMLDACETFGPTHCSCRYHSEMDRAGDLQRVAFHGVDRVEFLVVLETQRHFSFRQDHVGARAESKNPVVQHA